MAQRLVLFVLGLCILTCYVIADVGPNDCKPNEYFKKDYGGCDPDCVVPIKPKYYMCQTLPYPACLCRPGYLRVIGGDCVPVSQCPYRDCQKNQEFQITPFFDATCDEPLKNLQINSLVPFARCACVRGTYRNDWGDCVFYSACPQNPTTTKRPLVYL